MSNMTTVFISNNSDQHAYERCEVIVQPGEIEGPVDLAKKQLFRANACKFFDIIEQEEVEAMNKDELTRFCVRYGLQNTANKTKSELLEALGIGGK